jgi:hypothetical protein
MAKKTGKKTGTASTPTTIQTELPSTVGQNWSDDEDAVLVPVLLDACHLGRNTDMSFHQDTWIQALRALIVAGTNRQPDQCETRYHRACISLYS